MRKLVSLLLALCMMCSAMVAVAEQATQEVDGWVKYQVPVGLVEKGRVELFSAEQVYLECDQYQLTITTMDVAGVIYQLYSHWDERYLDDYVLGQYPREIAAMSLMLGPIMRSGEQGIQHALRADKLDAGMVDGQPIMAFHCPLYVLYSHYSDDKNGIGFVVEVRPQQGAVMTEAEMMQIAKAVCLSYQGLTEQYYDDNLEVVVTEDQAIVKYEEPKWPGWYDEHSYWVAEKNESFTVVGEYGAWYITSWMEYIPRWCVSVANLDGSNDMQSPASETVAGEQTAEESAAQRVVITADSGKIRTEASISGGLIKTAYKGETFELIEQSGDWYIVNVNGRTGYIHKGVAAIQ